MVKIMNCKNCGAPLQSSKCEYCGTIDFDLRERERRAIYFTLGEPCAAMSTATTFIFPKVCYDNYRDQNGRVIRGF